MRFQSTVRSTAAGEYVDCPSADSSSISRREPGPPSSRARSMRVILTWNCMTISRGIHACENSSDDATKAPLVPRMHVFNISASLRSSQACRENGVTMESWSMPSSGRYRESSSGDHVDVVALPSNVSENRMRTRADTNVTFCMCRNRHRSPTWPSAIAGPVLSSSSTQSSTPFSTISWPASLTALTLHSSSTTSPISRSGASSASAVRNATSSFSCAHGPVYVNDVRLNCGRNGFEDWGSQ